MARYAALKNLHIERQTFVARVTFAMVVSSALALLLTGRLVQLQVLQHDYYSTRSDENRMRLTVIPTARCWRRTRRASASRSCARRCRTWRPPSPAPASW
jgi:hypothetical protein